MQICGVYDEALWLLKTHSVIVHTDWISLGSAIITLFTNEAGVSFASLKTCYPFNEQNSLLWVHSQTQSLN